MVEGLQLNTSAECEITPCALYSTFNASSINVGENQAMYPISQHYFLEIWFIKHGIMGLTQ